MAAPRKKTEHGGPASLVDPVYRKFTRSVQRALSGDDFYRFFMESIANADNQIQFSNRREVKSVDPVWVENIEASMEAFQHIIAMPRQEFKEDELIVNVAYARRTGQDVVRHLSSHAALVEDYNEEDGTVRPSRVLQKYREESLGLYENRLVFTALEQAYHFTKIRHDALFGAMGDQFGAKLKVTSNMESATELVHMDLFLHIRSTESMLETDEKNRDIFNRISRLYRLLGVFMSSPFAQQLEQFDRVKGAIHKTNILKRNPDYKAAVKLLEFLRSYDQVGYVIAVVEQNPAVSETFEKDIYHNILFNYLILKGYLEDEESRRLPVLRKPRQRKLKPKFIKQVIEELTEDYDLPDVEVRKILIEELTKEQLMQEEAGERRRLVEEQAQRKKEEQARIKAEKAAEKARIKAEKEAEAARRRAEKEAEEQRRLYERMERETEDRRRKQALSAELEYFREHLPERLAQRAEAEAELRQRTQREDYADAVQLLDEAAQREQEERERAAKLRQEEKERRARERAAAEAQRRQERQEEKRRAEEEQAQQDAAASAPYQAALRLFDQQLPVRRQLRQQQQEDRRRAEEERRAAIQQRRQRTQSGIR